MLPGIPNCIGFVVSFFGKTHAPRVHPRMAFLHAQCYCACRVARARCSCLHSNQRKMPETLQASGNLQPHVLPVGVCCLIWCNCVFGVGGALIAGIFDYVDTVVSPTFLPLSLSRRHRQSASLRDTEDGGRHPEEVESADFSMPPFFSIRLIIRRFS